MPLNPVEIVGGLAIGEGVGMAIADVVEPQLRNLKNTQSAKFQVVPLPGELAARLIAESRPLNGTNPGQDAGELGISGPRFQAMIELARVYPTVSEALTLSRRWDASAGGYVASVQQAHDWITYGGFSDSIAKQLMQLRDERLDPAVIATGVQRSIFAPPSWLPVPDYAGASDPANWPLTVPSFRQTGIDADHEAYDSGIDDERLRVMTALVGLPLSLEQAASAHFRGIIGLNDFAKAVAEGNTRIEWGPAALEQARQILTANQYAELQLRGFLTQAERRRRTARHGMSQDDSDLLFDLLGRSINVHQIVTGEARGGTYKPSPATFADQSAGIPPAFLASLERGNLRPEYYSLAYANRYTYPSFFAVRGLLQGGVLTADEGYQVLLEMGWKPDLARKVADFYGVTGTTTADPHVAKAQTQLWNTIHRSYLNGESDQAKVETNLNAAGVALGAIPQIVAIWNVERDFVRKQLTPKQLRDAVAGQVLNLTTGAAWTLDEAIAELIGRGYSLADASTFMAE
jgi:hypothetical protein